MDFGFAVRKIFTAVCQRDGAVTGEFLSAKKEEGRNFIAA
jgi:hypothetical protein